MASNTATTERIVLRKPVKDGLFTQPDLKDSNDAKAKREMEERLNRMNFVAHFHYQDPWTPSSGAMTFDEEGNYNCGRCNKLDAKTKCLIIPIEVDPKAGSCKHWEILCAGDREIDVSKIGHTAEAAVYGVATNGEGFGCFRCPYASKAYAPDSRGRDLYCGKGDFRVPWNACCELNGAETTGDYEGNTFTPKDDDTQNSNPTSVPPAKLYIVRHGDTDLNSTSGNPERFRAWADIPLNDKGIESAHQAGQFLANKGIKHIFASDLHRNLQTAHIIGQHTGAGITPVRGLRPWNLGEFTGQPVEPNIKTVQKYQDKSPDTPLPGGESFNTFRQRWHETLQHMVHFSMQHGPIALVTHTRNLNELKARVEGRKTEIKSEQPPGGIVRMDIQGGRVKLTDEDANEGMKDAHGPQE